MPPQHGKSELISKYFPPWYLGHNPDNRIILSSYEADFAASWGRKARDIFKEYGPRVFNKKLREDSSSVKHWDIQNHDGGMDTSGAGGSQTGKKANFFNIDDPHKNPKEARSKVFQESIYDWYLEAADTRLSEDGIISITQTRWDVQDLSGRILENEPHLFLDLELLQELREGGRISKDTWIILHLPAIAANKDILGRGVGDVLCSPLFSLETIIAKRNRMGERSFGALYQGTPVPLEGNLLKREWLHDYTRIKNTGHLVRYQGWDQAISEKTSADYTTSCTVVHDTLQNHIYILDWTREHIDFPTQKRRVIEKYHEHTPSLIGFEDVAYQRSLPQIVQDESSVPLPIKLVPRISDKVSRILTRFVLFENGTVFVPKKHPLYPAFEEEFVTFNNGKHDDLLDATELALSLAMVGGNPFTESSKRYDYGTTSPSGVDHVRRWRRK